SIAQFIGQGKAFSVTIHQEKLSSTDKRRGIQWKGTGKLDAKMVRPYGYNTWSPWHAPTTAFYVTIIKESGRLKVQQNDEMKNLVLHKEFIECTNIESATK